MARRNDHTRAELHTNLLNAGREIIIAEGLDNLTARKLAASIGYAVGTIYNVFRNLTDVVLHINAQTMEQLTDAVEAAHPGSDDSLVNLLALTDAYIQFTREHPNLWRALFELHLDEGEDVPDWVPVMAARLFMLIAEDLKTKISDDQARIRAAISIWSGVHGLCTLCAQGRLTMIGAGEVTQMAHLLVTSFYNGVDD